MYTIETTFQLNTKLAIHYIYRYDSFSVSHLKDSVVLTYRGQVGNLLMDALTREG